MAFLVKMEEIQNAQIYTEVLQTSLAPFLVEYHPQYGIFQQDNTAIHTAKLTFKFFQDTNIETLSWLAKSLDLNSIEDLWGILSCKVNDNGKEYDDKEQL